MSRMVGTESFRIPGIRITTVTEPSPAMRLDGYSMALMIAFFITLLTDYAGVVILTIKTLDP